jgi:hypothetical protein
VTGWTEYHEIIPEIVVPGKPLGRHIFHDSRSLDYRWQSRGVPLTSRLWARTGAILNQGDVGACTGNAEIGALECEPLYPALTAAMQATLNETGALSLYSAAETIDGDGPYPPQDNGSSGTSVCQAAKNAGLISGYLHCLSVADMADALQAGPVIVGVNWYTCLPDDQRVLTSDLRWAPIQKVQVGDELIGFDESIGQTACYRRSRVTDMGVIFEPVYEIVTDQGTVSASRHHQFVRTHPKARQEWVRACCLKPGDQMAYFMPPYGEDTSWEAGWLAGFFDGEGTVAGDYQLSFGQALGPTLEKAVRLLGAKGYETAVKQYREAGHVDSRGIVSRKPLANVYVAGGYRGALRFLGEMRPERLLPDAYRLWEGKHLKSRRCPAAVVQDVRYAGVHPVHTIGTTTQTLIVEGFLSHNSFDTPDPTGLITITPDATVRGGHEFLVRGLDVTAQVFNADNSWGVSWGVNGSFRFSWDTMAALLAQQGDCTVPLPRSGPVPVPVPVPVPAPAPPAGDANPADVALARAVTGWSHGAHVGPNASAAAAVRTWLHARGFVT